MVVEKIKRGNISYFPVKGGQLILYPRYNFDVKNCDLSVADVSRAIRALLPGVGALAKKSTFLSPHLTWLYPTW